MKSSDIRQKFLDFFASKGHEVVASSSLVPFDDPTLLFTNAGMNQFKDVFLGFDKRTYSRATSSQKCVRAGGKHNDLENVGYTARHHTFFEMLGNFSFGDYFKREAIQYSWELLTKVYKLPDQRLWITVYQEDDEAFDIWHQEIGVPAERIIRIGDNKGERYASDNFWMMGDTGPCGPCSEIFYDHGAEIAGGPPGSPDEDGDRYIEIWNIVFMQFNRDENGVMHALPKPSVDTGMGLERIAAILQHVHANYDIDLFQRLIRVAAEKTATADLTNNSLKVLADHIRACSFLLADGVIPGNEGRGYVLRRIIRRAIRHGYKLGVRTPFFYSLVTELVDEMGQAFPELVKNQATIEQVLQQEEQRFFATIEHGMAILDGELEQLSASADSMLNGETAFKLHDTYGFPLDLTQDICREHQLQVDVAGFDQAMARQKSQARAAGKFTMAANLEYEGEATCFEGYQQLETEGRVLALYKDGVAVSQLQEGEQGVVVLDNTVFYAEAGGQVGDSGRLKSAQGIFSVEDTQKIQASVFGHHGVMTTGSLSLADSVNGLVNTSARIATERNHSVTHLMHKALREVLGEHVQQKGSLVDPEKARFDFVHNQPLTPAQLSEVECKVNAEILSNQPTQAKLMTIDQAQQTGAMMLFGEKYGDEVRVMHIGSSLELCGGTHVQRTGDIGVFKIVAEGGVAAGVRRVEAVSGEPAFHYLQQRDSQLLQLAAMFKAPVAELAAKAEQLQDKLKHTEKALQQLKTKLAASQGDDLVSQAVKVGEVSVLAAQMDGADNAALREAMDKLKDKLQSAVIVLAAADGDKVALVAGVTKNLIPGIKAGDLVKMVAEQIGAKGGGRPDMAMAGGGSAENLGAALASVAPWVADKI